MFYHCAIVSLHSCASSGRLTRACDSHLLTLLFSLGEHSHLKECHDLLWLKPRRTLLFRLLSWAPDLFIHFHSPWKSHTKSKHKSKTGVSVSPPECSHPHVFPVFLTDSPMYLILKLLSVSSSLSSAIIYDSLLQLFLLIHSWIFSPSVFPQWLIQVWPS